MNSPTLCQKYTHSVTQGYSRQNGTRQHYAKLPGNLASVHRPVHLKTMLIIQLTILYPGEWLSKVL